MRYSFAAVSVLAASQAYASSILPRQAPGDLIGLIPAACTSACSGLTSLQTTCADGTLAERQACICAPGVAAEMTKCTECTVEEVLKSAGASAGSIDPDTIQAGIDAAQEAYEATCDSIADGAGPGTGGTGSTGGAGGGGPGSNSGSTGGTRTTASNSEPSASAGANSGNSNTPPGVSGGNGALGMEVAGGAVALLVGAFGALFF